MVSIFVAATLFGALVRSNAFTVSAHGDDDHNGGWISGECIQIQCGSSAGKKEQHRTVKECEYSCPVVHFEWQTKTCPAGYPDESSRHPGYCSKGKHPSWPGDYKKMVEQAHSADVQYDKSHDPNKCHRPSDNDLANKYGMDNSARQSFKQQNSEWKNAVKQCTEHEESRTVDCTVKDVEQCQPSVTPTPCETTPTPTPTEDPGEPTPTPTEDPGQPTETPAPTPTDDPGEPTATPAPSQSQGSSSALGYNLSCDNSDIEVTYDVKKADGTTEKDVKVTFTYNGSTQEAKTNDNGRASVLFGKNGDGTVKATADGYADQSAYMEMPKDCPVTAPAVGGTTGQVLGASTEVSYANTGSATSQIFTAAQLLGMLMITAGAARYAYETIKS